MIEDDNNEGGLSRWSKRKLAVAKEQAQGDGTVEKPDAESIAAQEAKLQAELQANREAAEAVNLDELTEQSDFTIFMKAGVPELLKRRAMASLWRTSPVFANVDGLVDYDDDFASPDLIMKTFKSAYQIGKGYFDEEEEDEENSVGEVEETAEVDNVDENLSDQQLHDEELQSDEPEETSDLTQQDADNLQEDFAQEWESEMQQELEEIEASPPRISLRRRLELDQSS